MPTGGERIRQSPHASGEIRDSRAGGLRTRCPDDAL